MVNDDTGLRAGGAKPSGGSRRASDALVGRLLAGRYQVQRTVSVGAHAVVLDANDTQLSRLVTLKLIRPEFSEVPEFRRRFDQTMRAMSALSHPNIAAIHDWGETTLGGRTTVFAVVEYLGAGSLRDLFDRGRNLSPSQALMIGLEACRALDYAHRRGVVHSEVTPSKLVFGDDRRLRVIDFGLARLLGLVAWREPATVATHTARYASPEQALGQPIDGKTDVYALALCMIEAITGSVPFAADSTIATLSGRVGKLLPASADLGSLASVLERAGRPDRADRWTAAEFGRALVRAAETLPRPEALPLMTTSIFSVTDQPMRRPSDPTGGITRPADPLGSMPSAPEETPAESNGHDEAAVVMPAAAEPEQPPPDVDAGREGVESQADLPAAPEGDARPTSATTAQPTAPPPIPPVPPERSNGGNERGDEPTSPRLFDGDDDATRDELAGLAGLHATAGGAADTKTSPSTAVVPPIAPSPPPRSEASAGSGRRGRVWLRIAVALLLAATLAGLGIVAFLLFKVDKHPVPNLVGQNENDAVAAVEQFDWEIDRKVERSDEEPDVGDIIRTSPSAGEKLAEGEPLLLVVSEGPELRPLPDLVGQTEAEARTALAEVQLTSTTAPRAFHEQIPPGSVVSWQVAGRPNLKTGDEVLPETEVELTLSKGPQPRQVPDLRDISIAQARSRLDELKLELSRGADVFSDDIDKDLIVRQRPAPGKSVERGATITIQVSKGPDLVAFPDLEGLKFRGAVDKLERFGLRLGNVLGATSGRFQRARVDGVTIDPGEEFVRGTRVDLVFF